jgi:hypothetical protein
MQFKSPIMLSETEIKGVFTPEALVNRAGMQVYALTPDTIWRQRG